MQIRLGEKSLSWYWYQSFLERRKNYKRSKRGTPQKCQRCAEVMTHSSSQLHEVTRRANTNICYRGGCLPGKERDLHSLAELFSIGTAEWCSPFQWQTCLEASPEKEILPGKRKKGKKKKEAYKGSPSTRKTTWLNLGSHLSWKTLPLTSSSWQRP